MFLFQMGQIAFYFTSDLLFHIIFVNICKQKTMQSYTRIKLYRSDILMYHADILHVSAVILWLFCLSIDRINSEISCDQ